MELSKQIIGFLPDIFNVGKHTTDALLLLIAIYAQPYFNSATDLEIENTILPLNVKRGDIIDRGNNFVFDGEKFLEFEFNNLPKQFQVFNVNDGYRPATYWADVIGNTRVWCDISKDKTQIMNNITYDKCPAIVDIKQTQCIGTLCSSCQPKYKHQSWCLCRVRRGKKTCETHMYIDNTDISNKNWYTKFTREGKDIYIVPIYDGNYSESVCRKLFIKSMESYFSDLSPEQEKLYLQLSKLTDKELIKYVSETPELKDILSYDNILTSIKKKWKFQKSGVDPSNFNKYTIELNTDKQFECRSNYLKSKKGYDVLYINIDKSILCPKCKLSTKGSLIIDSYIQFAACANNHGWFIDFDHKITEHDGKCISLKKGIRCSKPANVNFYCLSHCQ